MSGELQPVRVIFRGWREQSGKRITEYDGALPSLNDIGASAREGGKPNWAYKNAKAIYSIMLAALLTEPAGAEYTFIKPGTQGVKCIMPPIEREGELAERCGFILVEGRAVFPTRHTRDQGNFQAIVNKFLGDVLEDCGFLEAHDDWLAYQFGNYERGLNSAMPAYTELTFFPDHQRRVLADEAAGGELF